MTKMNCQIVWFDETFSTFWTQMIFFISHSNMLMKLMGLKLSFCYAFLVTFITSIRLFSRVDSLKKKNRKKRLQSIFIFIDQTMSFFFARSWPNPVFPTHCVSLVKKKYCYCLLSFLSFKVP